MKFKCSYLVALALVIYCASATAAYIHDSAPVISVVPDIIVGDAESGTGSNLFVYPNALNLQSLVNDDYTSVNEIKWTYSNPGGHYLLNGRRSVYGSVADLVNPSSQYDLVQGDDPASTDSFLFTLTIRNKRFSPIGGPNIDPLSTRSVTTDTQTLWLIASDGSTFTLSNAFKISIRNNGFDQISDGGPPPPYNPNFTTGTNGWIQDVVETSTGTVILHNDSGGLCADASAQGINLSGWTSAASFTGLNDYHTVSLVDNSVYRARISLTTTAQPGLVPAWRFTFENTVDWYGGEFLFFDNGVDGTAGANAPAPAGARSVFEAWINAPAMQTAPFKAALANAGNASFKDFRLGLSVIDVGVKGMDPYGAAADAGMICWKSVRLDRFDINNMSIASVPYNVTQLTQPANAAAGTANSNPNAMNVADVSTTPTTSITYNPIVLQPLHSGDWEQQAVGFLITPGDATNKLNGGADMADNYPVPWVADQLYRIVYTFQAPDALAESNPPDYFVIGGDVPTNEVIGNEYMSTKIGHSGMPVARQEQEYIAFWHGNAGTTAPGLFKFMRPHLLVGTRPDFSDAQNLGGFRINAVRVEMVNFGISD